MDYPRNGGYMGYGNGPPYPVSPVSPDQTPGVGNPPNMPPHLLHGGFGPMFLGGYHEKLSILLHI